MLKNISITTLFLVTIFTGCSMKEDVTIVNEKGKVGALKSDSTVVIKPIYSELTRFDDSNEKNTKTEHPNVINLHWLHNYYGKEFAIAKYEDKYGVINKENKMIVKPIYDSISKLFNGFAIIKLDDKYGYMNNEFEVVQKPIFKDAREFLGNVAFVQSATNGKWGCINKNMELKINGEYDEIYNINNGFAKTFNEGKWGYIDDTCKVISEPKYDYAYDFSNDYAKVVRDNQVTYIDKKGNEISENIFTSGENF